MDKGLRPINDGKPWNREELILAFELYCRIPFQQTKALNPLVKKLATSLQRTPASVARKLGNFGSFDPQLKAKNIKGLVHTSRLDLEVWNEFHNDWAGLVVKAHSLKKKIGIDSEITVNTLLIHGPTERVQLAKQRLYQSFFRDTILSSYNYTCCITGLSIPECLIASHIIPWSKNEKLRVDPTNGLCLSATFDRLFDCGLIGVSEQFKILVSNELRNSSNPLIQSEICSRHNQKIILPLRFTPNPEHLIWHRENVYKIS